MDVTLEAQKRHEHGKNEARRVRQAGRIPAVVYGGHPAGEQPVGLPIAVDPKALMKILRSDSGVNTLITLRIDEDGSAGGRVLVKEYQLDPLSHRLLHVDFYRVAMDKALTVTVPVVLKGEPRGVKQQGGLMDFVSREIEVECLPGEIPEHIDIDVSEMLIGQSIRIRDLPSDPRWKPISDLDTMLVHVVAPRAEEVAAEAEPAVAAPAEPEVIKRGRPEKEETEE